METFAHAIASAIRAQWGLSPSARKEVGRITQSNERAVRNWFEGRNAPSGENLVSLMRHSDVVFETVLSMAGRKSVVVGLKAAALRDELNLLIELLDEIEHAQRPPVTSLGTPLPSFDEPP